MAVTPDNWQPSRGSHVVNNVYRTMHVFVITSPKIACMRQSWTTRRHDRVGHSIDEEYGLCSWGALSTRNSTLWVLRPSQNSFSSGDVSFVFVFVGRFSFPTLSFCTFLFHIFIFYRVISSCNISERLMARENMPRRKSSDEEMEKIRRTENCHETHRGVQIEMATCGSSRSSSPCASRF